MKGNEMNDEEKIENIFIYLFLTNYLFNDKSFKGTVEGGEQLCLQNQAVSKMASSAVYIPFNSLDPLFVQQLRQRRGISVWERPKLHWDSWSFRSRPLLGCLRESVDRIEELWHRGSRHSPRSVRRVLQVELHITPVGACKCVEQLLHCCLR